MAKSIQLAFEVAATVHQTVEILDDAFSEDDIIEGLISGELETTMNYADNFPEFIIRVSDTKEIAKISSQEVDGRLSKYR